MWGRPTTKPLSASGATGRLADTALALSDKAMTVCPVGVILRKRQGFAVPIGQRRYDQQPISAIAGEPPDGEGAP